MLIGAVLQDGGVVCFKAKRTTQFRKLMKAYCERQGGDPRASRRLMLHRQSAALKQPRGLAGHPLDQVAFLYDGGRIRCAAA